MLFLIVLKLIGPEAISLGQEMAGGTVLFLFLYLFLLFGVFFTIKKWKQDNHQQITFRAALIQGLAVSLSTATFSILFTYIFYELLYPDYVAETLRSLKLRMESLNIPEEKINEKLLEKKEYYRTEVQSFYSFVGNLITGVAFTLLFSFFLKSSQKN